MKVTRQPAYVLHTRPYRESSLLVDIFSRDHGRCRLIAKGVRSRKSGRRGSLMPFKPVLLGWSGKSALPILTAVESTTHLPDIFGTGLHAGLYVNELLLKMLRQLDAHTELYFAYEETVRSLSCGYEIAQTLRIFEKHLLHEIGFGLILDHDVGSGKIIDPTVQYVYAPESGPAATSAAGAGFSVQGATLRELDDEMLRSSQSHAEAKRLIRGLIYHQLGAKELRSHRVYRQLLRYQKMFPNHGKR